MPCRELIACGIILAVLIAAIFFTVVDANGAGNGSTVQRRLIDDRPQTVSDIEDRADAQWALNTAERWTEEDFAACDRPGSRVLESMQKCMHERTTARILYMLRRGCTGVSTIASACKMEVE